MRNHTRRQQALTIISTLTALAAGTYIAFGDGFTWDPYAYSRVAAARQLPRLHDPTNRHSARARHHHRPPHRARGTPRP